MRSTRLASQKQELLESEDYRYIFDRQLYINRAAKKAFSIEFVEDSSKDELERLIRKEPPTSDWRFFFNSEPSETLRNQLAAVLG